MCVPTAERACHRPVPVASVGRVAARGSWRLPIRARPPPCGGVSPMPPAPRSSIGRCTLYAHVRCIRQKERRDDRPVHRGLFADGDRRPLPRRRFVSGGASWSAVRSVAGPRVRLGSPSRRRRRRRCGGGAGGGAGLRGLCAAPRRQGGEAAPRPAPRPALSRLYPERPRTAAPTPEACAPPLSRASPSAPGSRSADRTRSGLGSASARRRSAGRPRAHDKSTQQRRNSILLV